MKIEERTEQEKKEMATAGVNFVTVPYRPREVYCGGGDLHRSSVVKFVTKKKSGISISASVSTNSETISPESPEIELEFIGPKAGGDGKYPVERATAVSGEKLLKKVMADSKIELYAAYGKVMNCGGAGSCGTCIVEILDGKDLLNERTNTELRYLKKKPETWRLACQTIVGNKENSGKVVVQRMPQWKK